MAAEGVATRVADAVRLVTATIAEARVGDTPRLDAELLVGRVTGMDRVALRVRDHELLTPAQWAQLDALVGRRAAGEPVAYLLGSAWFYGRRFAVDARVLVPRPETELLVELTLAEFAPEPEAAGAGVVVDACTGSGCVAVSVAAELGARVRVLATDLSVDALEVAAANAAALGAAVELRAGDLLEPVLDERDVAVVVANPPYVEGRDAAGLDPHVRAHEPDVALFLPGEGLEAFYARLASQARAVLRPGGLLAVEHGQGQRADAVRVLEAAGFADVTGLDDLAGIDRVVTGRAPGSTSR